MIFPVVIEKEIFLLKQKMLELRWKLLKSVYNHNGMYFVCIEIVFFLFETHDVFPKNLHL